MSLSISSGRELIRKSYTKYKANSFESAIRRLGKRLQRPAKLLVEYAEYGSLDEDDDEANLIQFAEELTEWPIEKRGEFFATLLPETGMHLARVWTKFPSWPIRRYRTKSEFFRSPHDRLAIVKEQLKCLSRLLKIKACHPAEFSSVDSLVRLGACHDFSSGKLDSTCLCRGNYDHQRAIGTMLAGLLMANDSESASVHALMRDVASGSCPNSRFGAQICYALCRSNREDLRYELLQYLRNAGITYQAAASLVSGLDSDIGTAGLVLKTAVEAGFDRNKSIAGQLKKALALSSGAASKQASLLKDCASFLTGDRTKGLESSYAALLTLWAAAFADIGQCTAAIRLPEDQQDSYIQSVCALAVELNAPHIRQALDALPTAERSTATRVAELLSDLDDNKLSSSEKHQALLETIELFQDFTKLRVARKFLNGVDPKRFVDQISFRIRRLWTTESVTVLGDLVSHLALRNLLFLPHDYIPPDQASRDFVISKISKPDPHGIGDYAEHNRDPYLEMILRCSLSIDDWLGILKNHFHKFHRDISNRIVAEISQLADTAFLELLFALLGSKDANYRSMGALAIARCSEGPHSSVIRQNNLRIEECIQANPLKDSQLAATTRRLLDSFGSTNPTLSQELFPDLERTAPLRPSDPNPVRNPKQLGSFLLSLDQFLARNEKRILEAANLGERQCKSLADLRLYRLDGNEPAPDWMMALDSIWDDWFSTRAANTRSSDGSELARAYSRGFEVYNTKSSVWKDWEARRLPLKKLKSLSPRSCGTGAAVSKKLKCPGLVESIVERLFHRHASAEDRNYFLEMAEAIFVGVPEAALTAPSPAPTLGNGQVSSVFNNPLDAFPRWIGLAGADLDCLNNQQLARLLSLQRLVAGLHPLMQWYGVPKDLALLAYSRGICGIGDVADFFLACGQLLKFVLCGKDIESVRTTSDAKANELQELLSKVGDRVIESETGRAQKSKPTEWTHVAKQIEYIEGISNFERLATKLSTSKLRYPLSDGLDSISTTLQLLHYTFPAREDSYGAITRCLKRMLGDGKLDDIRLYQLGMSAPQWLPFIDKVLGWKGSPAFFVWYIHHSKHRDHVAAIDYWNTPRSTSLLGPNLLLTESGILQQYSSLRERLHPILRPTVASVTSYFVEVRWALDVFRLLCPAQMSALRNAASLWSKDEVQARVVWDIVDAIRGDLTSLQFIKSLQRKDPYDDLFDLRPIGVIPLAPKADLYADLKQRLSAIDKFVSKAPYFEDRHLLIDQATGVRDMLAYYSGTDLSFLG